MISINLVLDSIVTLTLPSNWYIVGCAWCSRHTQGQVRGHTGHDTVSGVCGACTLPYTSQLTPPSHQLPVAGSQWREHTTDSLNILLVTSCSIVFNWLTTGCDWQQLYIEVQQEVRRVKVSK